MNGLSFFQALEQAERLARQSLPATLHERLSCAVALVRQGSVFQDDTGHWTVASATTPDKRYSVNGSCSCEDAYYRAPEGRCKHKLAQLLARKTQALLTVAQTGTAVPAEAQAPQGEVVTKCDNLPEAPASLNFKALIGGVEVQMTLRDVTEGAILDRLQAVLKRQDIRPIPRPAPRSGTWKRSNQGR